MKIQISFHSRSKASRCDGLTTKVASVSGGGSLADALGRDSAVKLCGEAGVADLGLCPVVLFLLVEFLMWCEIKPVSVKQRHGTAKTKRKSTGRKAEEGAEGSVGWSRKGST